MDKKLIGKCVDYTYDGKGIIKKDNKVVFVDGVLKDEEVEIEIIYESKNQTLGKLLKIIKSSPHIVKPFCPLAKECAHISHNFQAHCFLPKGS